MMFPPQLGVFGAASTYRLPRIDPASTKINATLTPVSAWNEENVKNYHFPA